MPRRSGSSERFLAKAPTLEADEVFLDLEAQWRRVRRPAARELIIKALNESDFGSDHGCCPRQRDRHTALLPRPDRRVEQAGAKLDAIMLPKVRSPGDVEMTKSCSRRSSCAMISRSAGSASKPRSRMRKVCSHASRSPLRRPAWRR